MSSLIHFRHELLIGVLQAFGMDSGNVAQVIGFKFSCYQQLQQPSGESGSAGASGATGGSEAPESLFKACALLIKHEIITVDQIYSLVSCYLRITSTI